MSNSESVLDTVGRTVEKAAPKMKFAIPGLPTTTPAFVTGFGVAFSDVNLANVTSLQFFDLDSASPGTYFAPACENGSSFFGVSFNAGEQIGSVRITSRRR